MVHKQARITVEASVFDEGDVFTEDVHWMDLPAPYLEDLYVTGTNASGEPWLLDPLLSHRSSLRPVTVEHSRW